MWAMVGNHFGYTLLYILSVYINYINGRVHFGLSPPLFFFFFGIYSRVIKTSGKRQGQQTSQGKTKENKNTAEIKNIKKTARQTRRMSDIAYYECITM